MCYSIAYLEKKARKLAERYKDFFPANWSEEHVADMLSGGRHPGVAAVADHGQQDPAMTPAQLDLFQDDDLPGSGTSDPDQAAVQGDLPTFYFVSGFSHPFLPVITSGGLHLYQWGLVPSWAKDTDGADEIRSKTLNARGETIFEKASFRGSILSQRCLLPVSGFYEWREVKKVKYPYFISVRDEDIFSLGCIYAHWTDRETGEVRHTFSIVTTPANPLMERIHNSKKRMPLIIARGEEPLWADPGLDAAGVRDLIRPFAEGSMHAYTVSRALNNPRNERNIPEALEEVVYEELE